MTVNQIGHYQILSKLGEGGMGVVYKARDGHLDRIVAIKILPQRLVAGEEQQQRFMREAKTASALNHPNIVTIHDFGHSDGRDFIVMEYIEGKTLDVLIGKTGLRFQEAIRYAVQIAEAAAAAHASRMIHRDLKPSNIIVTANGHVKVLDFGLAKYLDLAAPGPEDATQTKPMLLTEDGAIIGTAAYMSPEQAEGNKLDARTDIFSFGTILYEMLTGERPFRGATNMSTLAAILREEPKPVTSLSPRLPAEVDRIVARCLRKNPSRRYQTMADLKVALEELADESESGKLLPPVAAAEAKPTTSRRWLWLGLAVWGVAASAAAVWYATRPVPPRPEYSFRQLTFDSGLTATPAVSRDGKLVAYASDRVSGTNLDVYVQQVSGGKAVRLTDHPADDFYPSFSPDGSQIVFQSKRDGGGIYIVAALGGESRLLAKHGMKPQFSPDGSTIAFQVGDRLQESQIYLIPSGGGTARKLETNVPHAERPVWSPDGKSILFAGAKEGRLVTDWYVAPILGGTATKVGFFNSGRTGYPSQWLSDGRVLTTPYVVRNQRLTAVTLTRSHQFQSAESLAAGVGTVEGIGADSHAEVIVTAQVQRNSQIWSVPIDGNTGAVKGAVSAETHDLGNPTYPTVSIDDRTLAYNSGRSGVNDVYLRDLATGVERALTSSPIGIGRGELSPDGRTVAFTRSRGPLGSLFVKATQGGVEEKVCDLCVDTVLGWTPDNRQIITALGRPLELVLIDIHTGKKSVLLRHPAYDLHRGQFSPDGRWLAFNTKGGTESAIRITPYRNGLAGQEADWISVTNGTGDDAGPTWHPDGNLLYFYTGRAGFRDIWAQKLDPVSKKPVGEPFEVLAFHSARRPLNVSGKAVTRNRLFWSMEDVTGNIWVAERLQPGALLTVR